MNVIGDGNELGFGWIMARSQVKPSSESINGQAQNRANILGGDPTRKLLEDAFKLHYLNGPWHQMHFHYASNDRQKANPFFSDIKS